MEKERVALLYPHTYLRQDLAGLAFCFFDQLILLQPSEKRPVHLSTFLEDGLLQLVTPPPFGEKLDWFERLVKSYEEWGQMMRWPENLSMFKAWPEAVEESVSEIKALLLGKEPGAKEDPVLKARVILQLAHDLDKRLEELDQEYESLRKRASKLAEFVLGIDPGPKSFPKWVTEGQEPHWELMALKERLRAWSVLVPLLPSLPSWVLTDQWPVVEEILDLVGKDLSPQASLALEALSLEDLPESVKKRQRPFDSPEGLQKIEAFLSGKMRESTTGPRLELWRLPYETRSLLEAVSQPQNRDLQKGETLIFYLARF